MDKLTELKEKLANEYAGKDGYEFGSGEFDIRKLKFIKGFDAAMELQLPVKFAEWKDYNTTPVYGTTDKIISYLILRGIGAEYSLEALYKYWETNIYQPEK